MQARIRPYLVAIVSCVAALCSPAAQSTQLVDLRPGQPLIDDLAAGETHGYGLRVAAGDFVRVSVAGGGMVFDTVIATDRTTIAEWRRRGAIRDPIAWLYVADRPATLLVSIVSRESAGARRHYSIALEQRPAQPGDADVVAGFQAIARAEQLEEGGAPNAQSALAQYMEGAARFGAAGAASDEARALLAVGRVRADLGSSREAGEAFELAMARCRAKADAGCEANALHRLGKLQAATGQPAKGVQALQAALAIREQIADVADQAETLLELASAAGTQSDNAQSAALMDRSLERAVASGDRRTQADVLNLRGVIEASLGNPERARESYLSALTLRRAIDDVAGVGQSTSNLGVLHRALGEPRTAITYLDEALRIRRRLGAVQSLANTLHNLGVAYTDLSEQERALELFREALTLWRQSGGRRGEAFTLQNIGQSYAQLGDADKALQYYTLCAPLWKAVGDKRGEAQTLLSAAAIQAARGDVAKARADYTSAIAVAGDAGYKRELGIALTGRAAVLRAGADRDAALADARSARDVLHNAGERREEGRALAEIGAGLLASDEVEQSEAAYREALALLESSEDSAGEAAVRARLAHSAELRHDAGAAARDAVAALDLIESVRANISAEGFSVSLFASKRPIYDDVLALLMRLHAGHPGDGYDRMAFAVSERMRARALLDVLVAGGILPRGAQNADLAADVRRTEELINTKAARLTRLLGSSATRNGPAVAAARSELDDLLAGLDTRRAQLRARDPEFAALSAPQPLSLADVQAELLDDRTVLIEFAVGAGRSFGWAVTRTGMRTFDTLGRDKLDPLVRRFRDAITAGHADSGDAAAATARQARADRQRREAARALSLALVAPAADLIRTRPRIAIIADAALQSLSFGALPAPGRPAATLAETHEIVVLPSASVGAALRRRALTRAAPPRTIAAFADPVFSTGDGRVPADKRAAPPADAASLPRLRFSRLEADDIARRAPGATTVWSDFAANRTAALDPALARYGIVHIAAHAVIDDRQPQLSSIVLSQVDRQGRPVNGQLRVHEVYNLRLNARLVVLSACRTALGRQVDGEGLIGLSRGFLYAGADAVLATLWSVDDRATAAFMSRFYDGLLTRNLSPAAALRSARQSMAHDPRWSRPEHWAGFVLIGTD